jgi:hypothetical protein
MKVQIIDYPLIIILILFTQNLHYLMLTLIRQQLLLTLLCIPILSGCICYKHTTRSLPPQYLQIKDFKLCLMEEKISTYTQYCIPYYKPDSCFVASWKQLIKLDIPRCKTYTIIFGHKQL